MIEERVTSRFELLYLCFKRVFLGLKTIKIKINLKQKLIIEKLITMYRVTPYLTPYLKKHSKQITAGWILDPSASF